VGAGAPEGVRGGGGGGEGDGERGYGRELLNHVAFGAAEDRRGEEAAGAPDLEG
jgi:hypothetical protein